MILPWVRRERMEHYRRLYGRQCERIFELRGRATELEAALARSEEERRTLNIQLLRLSNGLPLFPDDATTVSAEAPKPAEPLLDFMHADESEINDLLVAQAVRTGLRTLPQIHQFVERRKNAIYAQRDGEDLELKRQAMAAVEESIVAGSTSGGR